MPAPSDRPGERVARRVAVAAGWTFRLPGRAVLTLAAVGQRAANGCTGWIAREPEVVLIFSFTLAAWTLFFSVAKFP